MSAFGDWFGAFVLTQAIEIPIYLRATRGRWGVAVLASTWTHPVVWFVFPLIAPLSWGYWGMVGAAESFAVLVEPVCLACFQVRHALGWGLIANGASLVVGLLLRETLGFP